MRRFPAYTVLLTLLLGALGLLSWSQTWFTFRIATATEMTVDIDVAGSVAAPAVVGAALLMFACGLVLLISVTWLRYLVVALLVLAAAIIMATALGALGHPVEASLEPLSKVTAIADATSLQKLIKATSVTFWPYISLFIGVCAAAIAILIASTAHRWPRRRSRYDRDTYTSHEPDAVESWDRLSAGDDPTSA